MDDDTTAKLNGMIKLQEGLRLRVYKDTNGYDTIGWGRNLVTKGISIAEANQLLTNDIADSEKELSNSLSWYDELDEVRQCVLISCEFNLGLSGLMQFSTFLGLMEKKDYQGAAQDLLTTLAAKQAPNRYQKLAYILETGTL